MSETLTNMDKVVYNIGYKSNGNSGILSWYPESFDCKFSEFVELVRTEETIEDMFEFAKKCHVAPSLIVLILRIENETQYWEYTVKMINVREYRNYWEKVYKKTWKQQ
jgi:hypothetical protein